MTFANSRDVATVVWILAIVVAAVITRPSSIPDLALLAAVTVAGLVVLRLLWRRPEQTISESIQDVRRP
jgi:hypothetical protein